MSGISSLNAALATLNRLAVAVTTSVTEAKTAVDAYGGDTKGTGTGARGGDGRGGGGDALKVATGGGGITNAGGSAFLTGLRAGATIVAAATQAIEKHVADQVTKINGATKDVVQQLIDAVALRDQAQADVLKYLQGRANEFYNGNAETVKVINLLTRWKAAQQQGNAAEMIEVMRQLRVEFDVINKILIGRANPKSGGLDLDRLLGAGAANIVTPINPTNSATSTGKAP